ncbi:hypothetical protein CVT25_009386 [Psilocybe cyanescens]|uniref:Transmembrane protein n=1 Tax=Psilocybe cyanescens TaxID=93625 RepID=A0A409XV52_PSICY|nr:hypothetical protein CVT25_009386 [Psilocybe cyanescens]
MTFLKVLRLVIFGSVTLLSLVILGSSSFLNEKSSPMFHCTSRVRENYINITLIPLVTMFTFPFAMSLIIVIERATHNKRDLPTVTFELPLLTLFPLWFICAHTGIFEFFGTFRHCNRGQGVGVMSAGLDVPSHCKIVAVAHGSEWLIYFGCKIFIPFNLPINI